MAQTGFTPIQLYSSSTTGNTPAAADLLNSSGGSELAINIFDGKLFYKDNAGAVQVIGWKIVPVSAGGTGQTSYTDGQLLIGNSTGNTLTKATLTAGTNISITNGAGAITINATGLSGFVPYTGATSAVDLNNNSLTNVSHLGIGTTSVPTILLRAVGDNNSTSRIAVRGYSSNANSSAIRVTKFRGTVAAPQAPQSGDSLGKFELAGYGTTSSDGYPQASFEGLATEAWGATARGAKTVIKVTPNTTITQVTAVTVDQDSKVTLAGALAVTGTTTLATTLSGLAKLTSGVVSTATSGTDYAPATSGTSILYGNGAGGFSNVTIGTGVSFAAGTLSATGSGGTVTSVAASVPAFLSISGSPITTSGTLAITYSGTALPVANGGTNATSASITAFNNITGYTASGATGTTSTNIVFSTSPTLTTPKATTTLGVGNATPSASGSGITFPATQSASTDVNTLDDYEEGTWTIGSTGTGTAATTGWYTKIGNQVTCWGAIYQQNASGPTTFTGLPFTSNAMDGNNNAGGYCFSQSGSPAGDFIGVQVTKSNTQYQLIKGFNAYAPVNGEVLKFVINYFV